MIDGAHQLVRRFFAAVAAGELTADLITEDMQAWTLSSGESDKGRFCAGIHLLSKAVQGGLVYAINSITAEDDRVVAEVSSDWLLINGERARNRHVFIFKLRDQRIASVAEYMDPTVPREIIGPLLQSMIQQSGSHP